MKVLAVDPGGATGMAYWQDGPPEEFSACTVAEPMRVLEMVRKYILEEKIDVLVCETFTISAGTAKKSREGSNTAIELIGAMRWLAYKGETPFVLQKPGDASGFCTDAKLRNLGWWTKGPDHARSATRHLVLYLASSGAIDLARLIQ